MSRALLSAPATCNLTHKRSMSQNVSDTGEKAILDILRQKGLLDQRLTAELAKVNAQHST